MRERTEREGAGEREREARAVVARVEVVPVRACLHLPSTDRNESQALGGVHEKFGFRGSSFGFRVLGSGFRVSGEGCRV